MSQVLDALPDHAATQAFLCCYVNQTSKVQIVRVTNVPNWYFERVAFPGQRLIFEAVAGAQLEIHTGMMASAIFSDRIACEQLALSSAPEAWPIDEDQQVA